MSLYGVRSEMIVELLFTPKRIQWDQRFERRNDRILTNMMA